MRISTCFLDASAWLALMDKEDTRHRRAARYFKELLETKSRLVTNNVEIDKSLIAIKNKAGVQAALDFYSIIDESILTLNLKMDWISRRLRRDALNLYLKSTHQERNLGHYFVFESVKRKKVDTLFTFDLQLRFLGLPIMPQD